MSWRLSAWKGALLGLVTALAFLIFAWLHRRGAAGAFLCAYVLISMVPIGSLALLLTHGITGGRWGPDLAPVLQSAARSLPLFLVAAIPILVFRSAIYNWADLHLEQDVTRNYLNAPFFDVRTIIALAIWSALAWTRSYRFPLFSGIGLAVHIIVMTFIPADWILTLSPGSISAGFGLGFAIEQIYAALAFAAVLAPQGKDPRANRDLAGLIVTSLLGTVYFFFVQFLITWYGNIPEKVKWYVVRGHDGWAAVVGLAFLFGAALPFVSVLSPLVRRDPRYLRIVGLLVLGGISLHVAWLITPIFGAVTLMPAVLAALALGALAIALAPPPSVPMQEGAHGG